VWDTLLTGTSNRAQTDDDSLYRLLQQESNLRCDLALRTAHRVGRPRSGERQRAIAEVEQNPYTLNELYTNREGRSLLSKMERLLQKTKTNRANWVPNHERYQRSKKRVTLDEVQKIQLEIVRIITERQVETDILHRRAQHGANLGGSMEKHFVRRINSRWAPLDRLVSTYNQEVTKAQYADRLRALDVNRLKEAGVDLADGEIWDIERLMSNSDWAVYDYIREGIDMQSRLDRVKEEHARLLLHTKRLVRWL